MELLPLMLSLMWHCLSCTEIIYTAVACWIIIIPSECFFFYTEFHDISLKYKQQIVLHSFQSYCIFAKLLFSSCCKKKLSPGKINVEWGVKVILFHLISRFENVWSAQWKPTQIEHNCGYLRMKWIFSVVCFSFQRPVILLDTNKY